MSSYSFSDLAIQDLDDICEYVASTSPQAASKLFDTIRQKCKLHANFPGLGKCYKTLDPNLRGFIVENYIILYYPRTDGIDVSRVINGYRDLESMFPELGGN
jgi:toxin ParE1/3/4